MKYDFVNLYTYSSEDIGEQFPEPLLDELDIHVSVDAYHGHGNVTGRSITGFFSVVGSTPTTWSANRQTAVKNSTFGDKFTALNKAVEDSVMI